jgi:sialidase-1
MTNLPASSFEPGGCRWLQFDLRHFRPGIAFASLLLVLLRGLSSEAAIPFLESKELFPATTNHYYHIPGLVITRQGSVLAYAERRNTNAHDWGDIQVVLRRSTDGGRSWGAERQVAHLGQPIPAIVRSSPPKAKGHEQDVTINNPLAIGDRNGSVHFIYCVEYRRVFYMRSDNDGASWSTPVELSQVFEKLRPEIDWKVIATGPGHGIQLANGRLVVPIWLATGEKEGFQHRPSVTAVAYSNDHGSTWSAGEIAARTTGRGENPQVFHNPNETEAVELANGSVLFNVRSGSFRQRRVQSVSADGATRWSKPEFIEDLPEPIDFGSIARYARANASGGKNILLFSIPDGLKVRKDKPVDEKSCFREDLTVFVSEDEGRTWPKKKIIHSGPIGCGYSDLAVLPDKTILCAHGTGKGFGAGAGLALTRFNLDWLLKNPDSQNAKPSTQ